MSKFYLKNINGLRFIAALAVVIHHIELYKSIFGLDNYWNSPSIKLIGPQAVNFFFVLSGFLITYLLLIEERAYGTISMKKLYLRRIFRIWPLYFLIILCSWFLLPQSELFSLPNNWLEHSNGNFWYALLLFLFMMPNVLLAQGIILPHASQAWSIGTEEQFYVIWPWLFKKIKNKLIMIIGVILCMKLIAFTLYSSFLKDFENINLIKGLFLRVDITSMALGGLGAWIVFQNYSFILKFICHRLSTVFIILTTGLLIISGYEFVHLNMQAYAILFLLIIINLSSNQNTIRVLDNKTISLFGKISYGIYMYHSMVITACINVLIKIDMYSNTLLYISSITLTILISHISYKYIEYPFLKIKKRNQLISSTN